MIRGAAHKVAHLATGPARNIVDGVEYAIKRMPAREWDGDIHSICTGCAAKRNPALCDSLNANPPHKGKCSASPVSQGSIVWVPAFLNVKESSA